MIKATATGNGRTILLLALSHANLDRLREDGLEGFIKILGEEVGIGKIDIMITAGETEAAIAKGLKRFIGPDTIIHEQGARDHERKQ